MPYSSEELEDIEKDPVRLQAYYWRMSEHWKRLAREYRQEVRRGGGPLKLDWADALERMAIIVVSSEWTSALRPDTPGVYTPDDNSVARKEPD